MKKRKLNYRFHNPNSAECAADYILKICMEADRKKIDKILSEMANKNAGKEISQDEQYDRRSLDL